MNENNKFKILTYNELYKKLYSVRSVFKKGGIDKALSHPVLLYRNNIRYFVSMLYISGYGDEAPDGFIVYNEHDDICQHLHNREMAEKFNLPLKETYNKPIDENHVMENLNISLDDLFEKNVLSQPFDINLYIEYIDACIKRATKNQVRYYEMFKEDILKQH